MSFTSKRGIKRRCRRGVGLLRFQISSSNDWAHRAKLTSFRVLGCIPALAYPGISTSKSNHVFGFLFNHSHVLLNWPSLHFYQPALLEGGAELVCPAITTEIPDNRHCHLLGADRGKEIWPWEYLTPLHSDIYVKLWYTFIMQRNLKMLSLAAVWQLVTS